MGNRREDYIRKKNTTVMIVLGIALIAIFFASSDFGTGLFERLFGEKQAQAEIRPVVSPKNGEKLQVYYLDIGQGDCEFIRIPKDDGTYFNMLIDSGEYQEREKLLSFLKKEEITRLDAVVVTHPHSDHMGSMATVIRDFEIGAFYMSQFEAQFTPTTVSYEKMLDALTEKNLKITVLKAGDMIPVTPAAAINVLSPIGGKQYTGLNEYSIILKLVYGDSSFLFTGDAQIEAFSQLTNAGYHPDADILKVGHHGSADATNGEILDAVTPKIAVISCGDDNDYGHPHKEVLGLLEKYNCRIFRTDQDGTVLIETDGKTEPVVTTEKNK
ncbi:MAG: ComEC/Rec2 family competence protein [Oscillospiraceae bacterium]